MKKTATKQILLTSQGLDKIKKELDNLLDVLRPKAVDRVAKARDLGDLNENSEYSAAREELDLIETRIDELNSVISQAKVFVKKAAGNIVELGSTVVVEIGGQVNEFTIVGSVESDPLRGKISNESPVGKALVGSKIGDVVIVSSSIKTIYKIKNIK